ncbi:threonine dehydratase [Catenaria anguillulae PL171]|uniref:Threonine dehydratase n=1 Tax=Catenaria anguillulae PL171 TaxID=765915 RepID=A0A1Y2HF49_9FUNG|nr:threonine dehydratase [Catenaria anguillulae PL171]
MSSSTPFPLPWPSPLLAACANAQHLTRDQVTAITTHPAHGTDYLLETLNARVYDVAIESPLVPAPRLSARLASTILLKREDLQPVFSFKLRGAFNKLFNLTPEERARGVIAVSAGNHAQGVALAAQKLGIRATICMPVFAPKIKVDNVRRLGGHVVLSGSDFDECKQHMLQLAKDQGAVIIPPFDDPKVIAGQATVGMEILHQVKQDRLDAIFVCCGGGGLLAGIAAYVKRVRPHVRIVGVNTVDSRAMAESIAHGKVMAQAQVGLFSDGSAVRVVGDETYRLASQLVDDMITVTTDEVCAAIRDVFEETRSILEPAGALSVAGCRKYLARFPQLAGGVFACVLSGANASFDRLGFIADRTRIGDGREALVCARIPEVPGSFIRLYDKIHPRNVTELVYRFGDTATAKVFIGFEISRGQPEVNEVVASFNHVADGTGEWSAVDLTQNELAKHHARYLCAGKGPHPSRGERFFSFVFPERPGSLAMFLKCMSESALNCTLFHYRYRGGDMSRVLVGLTNVGDLQGHDDEEDAVVQGFLSKLGFEWAEHKEGDDPAMAMLM